VPYRFWEFPHFWFRLAAYWLGELLVLFNRGTTSVCFRTLGYSERHAYGTSREKFGKLLSAECISLRLLVCPIGSSTCTARWTSVRLPHMHTLLHPRLFVTRLCECWGWLHYSSCPHRILSWRRRSHQGGSCLHIFLGPRCVGFYHGASSHLRWNLYEVCARECCLSFECHFIHLLVWPKPCTLCLGRTWWELYEFCECFNWL
jgi:hypothetical protein